MALNSSVFDSSLDTEYIDSRVNFRSITAKTTDYTMLTTDYTVLVNASGGNVTITLPTMQGGQVFNIKKTDSTHNLVIVTSASLIDGELTQTLAGQYDTITVQNNGSTWYIIAVF